MASICCASLRKGTCVKVFNTALPGLKLLEPRVFNDDRGFFCESWNARAFAAAESMPVLFRITTANPQGACCADCITR